MSGHPLPSLAGAAFLRTPGLDRVIGAIEAAGGEARVVGGAVRNALLGRPQGDVDVATPLTPEAVMAAARAAGIKAVPTGIDHGTVTLVARGHGIEVTTLRKDVETDGRRAVVSFTTDWRTDAERRDFTMNALYVALDGQLFDPVGGYDDLAARHVRFIGDAETRIREDYLRILRFFRFHAELGRGQPDADGLAACGRLAQGLGRISRERVRHELLRLLAAPGAMSSVEAMVRAGVLAAIGLGAAHVERLGRLVAVDAAQRLPGDGPLRLAALALGPEHDVAELVERFRLANEERDRLLALSAGHADIRPGMDGRDLRVLAYRLGRARLLDRVRLEWAASGAEPDSAPWREILREASAFQPPSFPITGRDLIAHGARPGPALGKALADLESAWLEGDFRDGREALIARFERERGRPAPEA